MTTDKQAVEPFDDAAFADHLERKARTSDTDIGDSADFLDAANRIRVLASLTQQPADEGVVERSGRLGRALGSVVAAYRDDRISECAEALVEIVAIVREAEDAVVAGGYRTLAAHAQPKADEDGLVERLRSAAEDHEWPLLTDAADLIERLSSPITNVGDGDG